MANGRDYYWTNPWRPIVEEPVKIRFIEESLALG